MLKSINYYGSEKELEAAARVIDDLQFIDGIVSWDGRDLNVPKETRWGRASEPSVAIVQVRSRGSTEMVTAYGIESSVKRFEELVRAKESCLAKRVGTPSG